MKHRLRKTMQMGFVMDVMDEVQNWNGDTSFSIMKECERRGHTVWYIEPNDLFFRGRSLYAYARGVKTFTHPEPGFRTLKRALIDLKTLDCIFNRKEPPFDMSYLYLMQLLKLIEGNVFVINSPSGMCQANEKMYILEFQDFAPPTLISNDPERIARFQKDERIDLILKPLDQKGGAGIKLIPKNTKNARKMIKEITECGKKWIMAQKFLRQGMTKGDKRILLLNGEILGQFGRMPKAGEFRANMMLGGTPYHTQLTAREKNLVREIRPKLLRDGLYFVGLDVIDGLLLEINVTSPAGIPEINELEGLHLETQVVDFLEAQALKRRV